VATPRKKYFRVADSILREPWPRDLKLTCVLLQAHLNTRWRRDGISHDKAGQCTLTKGAWTDITGRSQFNSALNLLQTLGELVTISVQVENKLGSNLIRVDWPKFAEFQDFGTRSLGQDEPLPSPSPSPSPTPKDKDTMSSDESGGSVDKPTATELARECWPDLRSIALGYGVKWAEKPGKAQIQIIASRIRDDDLNARDLGLIIKGYVNLRGTEAQGDFNPLAHLVPKTLFRASNWPDYLAAGKDPPPKRVNGSGQKVSWAQQGADETKRNAQEVFRLARGKG